MKALLQKIEEGIQNLPPKDRELSIKFLANRDFDSIKEIADSCLYMKKLDDAREIHKQKWITVNRIKLEDLILNLVEYMFYLSTPDELQ